jgi:hypothetical protein
MFIFFFLRKSNYIEEKISNFAPSKKKFVEHEENTCHRGNCRNNGV